MTKLKQLCRLCDKWVFGNFTTIHSEFDKHIKTEHKENDYIKELMELKTSEDTIHKKIKEIYSNITDRAERY